MGLFDGFPFRRNNSRQKGITLEELKTELDKTVNKIMSAISDFATSVNAKLDAIGVSIDGIEADVKFLKDTIEKLQNNPGPITPEDQALLDAAQARVGVIADKLSAIDAGTVPAP